MKTKHILISILVFFCAALTVDAVLVQAENTLPEETKPAADVAPETGISEYSDVHDKVAPAIPGMGAPASDSTADHSKFKELQGPFADGPAVTQACLNCHNKAGEQFMHSLHWKWEFKHPKTGQTLGKKTLINNFCTNARGNEGMCSQCHAAYNHTDYNFDYSNPKNIDCVICHDQTGTYYKTPSTEGHEACSVMFKGKKPIDWNAVAQSVGKPTRRNCGQCHFFGGGGDNVKHGDLSSALIAPDKDLDVHMDKDGLNFSCQECHVTKQHITSGSRYEMMANDEEGAGLPGLRRNAASCESCHGNEPHDEMPGLLGIKLNGHVNKVACATCHIPEFARGGVATKTHWDWRTSGKLNEKGEGYKIKEYTQGNGEHRATYKSIKGDFKYDENVVPHYAWFDGTMNYTTIDTVFDTKKPVEINGFTGSYDDPKSRIWPFKRMHTIMPYDAGNDKLVYMHLWGTDDSAFWGNYDMKKSIEYGMKEAGKEFSGDVGFVDTYSYWPITHMVTPKEKAMKCGECHAREGRLKDLPGFYMPGRDYWWWLDWAGFGMLALAGLTAIGHGSVRYVMHRRRKRNETDNQGEDA